MMVLRENPKLHLPYQKGLWLVRWFRKDLYPFLGIGLPTREYVGFAHKYVVLLTVIFDAIFTGFLQVVCNEVRHHALE